MGEKTGLIPFGRGGRGGEWHFTIKVFASSRNAQFWKGTLGKGEGLEKKQAKYLYKDIM